MNKIILPIFLIATQVLFSQVSKKEQKDALTNNAKEIRMSEYSGVPEYVVFHNDYDISHEKAIEYSKSFFMSDNVDFILKNNHRNKNGKSLYRYEQTFAGYPVEFSAWHVHVKNGRVTSLTGDIIDIQDFNPVFSISEYDALQAALNHIGAEKYMWQDENEEQNLKSLYNDDSVTYYPKGTKVIVQAPPRPSPKGREEEKSTFEGTEGGVSPHWGGLRGAFRFDIFSKFPYNRKMVYVDAQTGEILFDLPLIKFSDEIGIAHTQYSGIQEINTFFNGTQYILQDNTRGNGIRTLNCQNGANYGAAVNFFDDDNIWNNVNAQLNQYATDAHFATMSTYDISTTFTAETALTTTVFDSSLMCISTLSWQAIQIISMLSGTVIA